jgi:hypothetical protein
MVNEYAPYYPFFPLLSTFRQYPKTLILTDYLVKKDFAVDADVDKQE